jgi:predicted nucleic acid-binding protein
MSIPVLYDACVLYGNEVRDLLIRIAISGMVRAHWTDEILDEAFRNLLANRPDLSPDRLTVTRERMNLAIPGALVSGYEPLVEALKLPDPDDRHVLAAAIAAGAAVIVTSNLDDFPADALETVWSRGEDPG